MTAVRLAEEAIDIPEWDRRSLPHFREWFHSDSFPEEGTDLFF